MNRKEALRGLYAITDGGEDLVRRAEAVLRGGAALLQYRDKSRDHDRRLREARALAASCRRHGALFIVNDDIELARACDADGVHLGRDDATIAEARRRLGDRIIGVSCYNDAPAARQAQRQGADYVAFGAFFPSATKPGAVRATPDLLRWARAELALPVVAIGGIDATNAAPLIAVGADMVAAVGALFGAPDPEPAARELARLFHTTPAEGEATTETFQG